MSGSILVTGASGQLGKRVVELLLERGGGARVIAATRKPEGLAELKARGAEVRHADFNDQASLATAFQGVERALLISTDSLDEPGKRQRQHSAAIKAFKAAGVQHVAYTSIINPAPSRILISADHAATEAELEASGLQFTVLRNNMYSNMLLVGTLQRAIAAGKLVNASGAGKVGYVTREDCARIAAAVMTEPPAGNQKLDVTGPETLSGADVAALVSEISGKKVEYLSIPLGALIDGMVQHGLPRPLAEVYASFDAGTAAGELDVKSDSVERFTGKKPQALGDFLRANKAAWLGS
ncbi:MAG TPA: SDR family oxidoreductase [Polyangiaceae bacterium]|nr:SDR family oxidoreductase [Polyangiaceae bacterium]